MRRRDFIKTATLAQVGAALTFDFWFGDRDPEFKAIAEIEEGEIIVSRWDRQKGKVGSVLIGEIKTEVVGGAKGSVSVKTWVELNGDFEKEFDRLFSGIGPEVSRLKEALAGIIGEMTEKFPA